MRLYIKLLLIFLTTTIGIKRLKIYQNKFISLYKRDISLIETCYILVKLFINYISLKSNKTHGNINYIIYNKSFILCLYIS